MTHVITRACCNDAACVDVCPVDCIHPTPDDPDYLVAESLYIDPATCIDCSACVEVCPVDAIVPDYDLTPDTRRFADINAMLFTDRSYARMGFTEPAPTVMSSAPRTSLRVAIVGSGPAAMYAAEALNAASEVDTEIHVFDRLAAPWGLVRHGVAPDHQDTKRVVRAFERTARAGALHLNVEVGRDVTHDELLSHFHAVLYAVGASGDRRLGISGEDLAGSTSATDFVAWYNGHPDATGHSFDLSGPRAVVVGNGNVALDVARILARPAASLGTTDIAPSAEQALRGSAVEEVVVLGRRGPAEAAYTIGELYALAETPGIALSVEPEGILEETLTRDLTPLTRMKTEILRDAVAEAPVSAERRIVMRFLASPVEVLGDDRVRAVRVARNALSPGENGVMRAQPTDETELLDCDLLLRSVGYRGSPVDGLPFDETRGTLPHREGRVVDPATGEALVGVYAAGWIKRGPTGVIGTNRRDAEETVDALLEDARDGRLGAPAKDAGDLVALLDKRGVRRVDLAGWMRVDRFERDRGRAEGRPRVKVLDLTEALAAASGAAR